MSTKRLKLKRSLSWLFKPQAASSSTARPADSGREDLEDYEHVEHESLTEQQISFQLLNPQRENFNPRRIKDPSNSRRYSHPELGPGSPLTVARPPPFFYPRRLSPTPEHSCEMERSGDVVAESVHDGEGSSNVSITSSEIASWKHTSTAQSHKSSSKIGRGLSRVSSLSLRIKTGHGSGKINPLKANLGRNPDSSLPISDTSAIPYSLRSDLPELTFTSTNESKSLDTVRSSLLPPPRPARKKRRLKDPFKATQPKGYIWNSSTTSPGSLHSPHSTEPGIDPARWAEISISAAELVQKYGKDNLFFAATPQSQYADGNGSFISLGSFEDFGEETSEDIEMEDVDVVSPMHASISVSSSPSPYKRTMVQDHSPQPHSWSQSLSQRLDLSLARSSTADSMTSFSKWPLPPTYDRFKPQSQAEQIKRGSTAD